MTVITTPEFVAALMSITASYDSIHWMAMYFVKTLQEQN
jgi:hypothetical protein